MLTITEIHSIYKNKSKNSGYCIQFKNDEIIYLTKRRTIIALLVLIHNGEGSEADLAKGNKSIAEIKSLLINKIPDEYILDFYGDANKPFSELWNEEGFPFIDNLKGGRLGKSQKYTLKPSDHFRLFNVTKKANRKAPVRKEKEYLRKKQKDRCNICGSKTMPKSKLTKSTFAKDRRREVFDHRLPVEHGGDSNLNNYQVLCFYCNKSKWQICNICDIKGCHINCALRNPENNNTIYPTGENISDILMN